VEVHLIVDGGGSGNSLASDLGVEGDDDGVLLLGEAAVPDVWPEVVEPPQPAALAASLQPCDHMSHTRQDQSINKACAWYRTVGSERPLCLTGFLGQGDPVADAAVALDVAAQRFVLLRRPRAPLHGRPVAARRPSHGHRTPPTQVLEPNPAARSRTEKQRKTAGQEEDWLLCREQVVLQYLYQSFVRSLGGHCGLDPFSLMSSTGTA
jgi:hypothetical protein